MINLFVRNKIKEVCQQKNMTLRELSELTGIGEHTIYNLQGRNLRIENAARIMVALDASFDELFEVVVLSK